MPSWPSRPSGSSPRPRTRPARPAHPPAGKNPNQILSAVGADAFAELTNNIATIYNAQPPAAPTRVLASYDAINPVTGAAGRENITTKPGCASPAIPRPNGANAGITALLANQKSTVDTNEYCIDFVRSSRAKGAAPAEQSLTFYAQSRDAVSYAVIGNAYAPVAPLTTAQLKDIFECTVTDWSQVGGQAGAIHLYLPPASAATYTFFLQAIGSSLGERERRLHRPPDACSSVSRTTARSMNGDPQGIAAVRGDEVGGPEQRGPGIIDFRGGAAHRAGQHDHPAVHDRHASNAVTYQVLNPAFATGASASFGRLFFNTVRTTRPRS